MATTQLSLALFGVTGCERWKCCDLEHGQRVLGYWPTENADVAPEDVGKPPEMIGNDKPPLEQPRLAAVPDGCSMTGILQHS